MSNAKLENLSKFVKKLFLSRKLICKIHRTKQKELEKFNLQSFYFVLNMIKSRKIFFFCMIHNKDVVLIQKSECHKHLCSCDNQNKSENWSKIWL